ncbi:MAG: BolA family transcriptional regulator [Gammaproteobacteria bacterium]
MTQTERMLRIRERLTAKLQPLQLEIVDDSHSHAGHAGARGGAGHFTIHIVAQGFADKTLIERHRMIYDLLQDMMHSEIHALSIQARSPSELQASKPTTTQGPIHD